MRYEPLVNYSKDEINEIISNKDEEKIKLLPLSIGEYQDDLTYAQDFCIKFLDNNYSDEIRANAVLGLSYIARRFRMLDKSIMPILQKELIKNKICKDRVQYSIEDIKFFMHW